MSAVLYAGLVGRYIRMERPATAEERAAGSPDTVGMECLVALVQDKTVDGRPAVSIVADYGYGYTIFMDYPEWKFMIWPDEETARLFRTNPPAAGGTTLPDHDTRTT